MQIRTCPSRCSCWLVLLVVTHFHSCCGNLNTLIGLRGKDFVLLGGDTCFFRGLTVMEGGYKKVMQLDDTLAAAASGPKQGDVEVFVDWLQRVLCLKRMSSGGLTVSAAASLARRQLAQDLRRRPMDVNMLLGGWDKVRGAQLYWLDGMGSLQPIPFGAHGAASSFVISVLDKGHRGEETELGDAVRLMRDCVAQLSTRYLVRGGGFQMMVVDASGCRDIGCGECVLGGEGAGAQDGAAEAQQQQRRHLSGVDR